MTIILDMANGTIQSDSTPETGNRDRSADTAPDTQLRLAHIEAPARPAAAPGREASYYVIRSLLLSE